MVRASASQLSYNRVEVRISKITDDNSYVLFSGAAQYNIIFHSPWKVEKK